MGEIRFALAGHKTIRTKLSFKNVGTGVGGIANAAQGYFSALGAILSGTRTDSCGVRSGTC